MKCCGFERETPFCPMCGAAISKDPLRQLMAHVNSTVSSYQDRTTSPRKPSERDEDRYKRRLERDQRTLAKWLTWQKALGETIDNLKKNSP